MFLVLVMSLMRKMTLIAIRITAAVAASMASCLFLSSSVTHVPTTITRAADVNLIFSFLHCGRALVSKVYRLRHGSFWKLAWNYWSQIGENQKGDMYFNLNNILYLSHSRVSRNRGANKYTPTYYGPMMRAPRKGPKFWNPPCQRPYCSHFSTISSC